MKTIPVSFDQMVRDMLRCEQTQGQSVYQHGQSVDSHLQELIGYLEGHDLVHEWRIPKWLEQYKSQLLDSVHERATASLYALYHDCGKPYCRTVDDDGRVHFPDHANVSKAIYEAVGGSIEVANLIGWDMCLHTATADEIAQLCQEEWSVADATTLLLAALAEVHSNAKMFGGLESTSFKSKWKKVDRRGNQICKFYFGEPS